MEYYETISLKNVSIEKEDPQKNIIKIPDDVNIYAYATKKQYSTAGLEAIKKILTLSVKVFPKNKISEP